MFGKDKKETPEKPERFVLKETHTVGLCSLYVICDKTTGVHYLATGGDTFYLSSITPLLDENGKAVIDKYN